MKVIFLDFNGIVDTYEDMDEINLGNLERLKRLCELCNASVVYSSSNRYSKFGKELIIKMMELGLNIVGLTPKLDSREEEINKYLEEHPEIDNYVVLDDDYDMDFGDRMIKLPMQGPGSLGFTEEYYVVIHSVGLFFDRFVHKMRTKYNPLRGWDL